LGDHSLAYTVPAGLDAKFRSILVTWLLKLKFVKIARLINFIHKSILICCIVNSYNSNKV